MTQRAIATPPGQPTQHVELTVQEELDRQVEENLYFNRSLSGRINEYRRTKTEIEIDYSGVKIINNVENAQDLIQIINYLSLKNDNALNIKWKYQDTWRDTKIDEFQGLLISCGDLNQLGFNALKIVLQNHALTPYTSLQDAYDDFDIEMGRS